MKHHFRTKLMGYDRPGAASYIAVPKKVVESFAPLRRIPIEGTINGVEFKATIADMGPGPGFVVTAEMRAAADVQQGDPVVVVIRHDKEKRTVTIPRDLLQAMSIAECARFKKFSYALQAEYVEAIEAAKRSETRTRRIEKTVAIVRSKM